MELLFLLIFIPFFAALYIYQKSCGVFQAKQIALGASLFTFFISLFLWIFFDKSTIDQPFYLFSYLDEVAPNSKDNVVALFLPFLQKSYQEKKQSLLEFLQKFRMVTSILLFSMIFFIFLWISFEIHSNVETNFKVSEWLLNLIPRRLFFFLLGFFFGVYAILLRFLFFFLEPVSIILLEGLKYILPSFVWDFLFQGVEYFFPNQVYMTRSGGEIIPKGSSDPRAPSGSGRPDAIEGRPDNPGERRVRAKRGNRLDELLRLEKEDRPVAPRTGDRPLAPRALVTAEDVFPAGKDPAELQPVQVVLPDELLEASKKAFLNMRNSSLSPLERKQFVLDYCFHENPAVKSWMMEQYKTYRPHLIEGEYLYYGHDRHSALFIYQETFLLNSLIEEDPNIKRKFNQLMNKMGKRLIKGHEDDNDECLKDSNVEVQLTYTIEHDAVVRSLCAYGRSTGEHPLVLLDSFSIYTPAQNAKTLTKLSISCLKENTKYLAFDCYYKYRTNSKYHEFVNIIKPRVDQIIRESGKTPITEEALLDGVCWWIYNQKGHPGYMLKGRDISGTKYTQLRNIVLDRYDDIKGPFISSLEEE